MATATSSLYLSTLTSSSTFSTRHHRCISSYNPSRRLTLFHLGAAVSQVQNLGAQSSSLLKADENVIEAVVAGNMAQASTLVTEESVLAWAKNDNRRMLHVVYKVGNLDKTIKFYTECLGMKLLRKRDIPEERYSNAFLGYGPEETNFSVELTYNYGVDKYNIGEGLGHFGIAVEDVVRAVDIVKAKGGKVTREPGLGKGKDFVTASLEDPDGYTFQLIERAPNSEPFCQVMLRVGDLERAIKFYEKAYGMNLLRKRDTPEYKKMKTTGYQYPLRTQIHIAIFHFPVFNSHNGLWCRG